MGINNLFKVFIRKAEINRAVFFGILSKLWRLFAGPVSALVVVAFFTSELQGYYYTFFSLIALRTFVELGLGTVIVQFASHEWSKLSLDKTENITGDRASLSRLSSLARFVVRWYIAGGLVLTVALGAGGYMFFSQSPDTAITWIMPWFVLCLVTGLSLSLIPLMSLLEGCNQVSSVYACRFWQNICMSLAAWTVIMLNGKLWAASISSLASLACIVIFILRRYRRFFITLFSYPIKEKIYWRLGLWPMQWRIALSYISGYFILYFFIPVLFKYHGPVVAGQMGMTWSLVGLLPSFCGVWISPKAPQFGMLIAKRKFKELDRLFWRLMRIVMILAGSGAIAIFSLVYILNMLNHPFANRLLSPLPVGLFLLSQIMVAISYPLAVYLRAHKKEPLLFLTVMSAVMVSASNLILGKYYSATGMAVGYLITNMIVVPLVLVVWYRCRAAWHSDISC